MVWANFLSTFKLLESSVFLLQKNCLLTTTIFAVGMFESNECQLSTQRIAHSLVRAAALAVAAASAMPPASSAAAAVPRINQHVKVEAAAAAAYNANRRPSLTHVKKDFCPDRNRKRREDVHRSGLRKRKMMMTAMTMALPILGMGTSVTKTGFLPPCRKVAEFSLHSVFFIRDSLKMSLECLLNFLRICLGLSLKVFLSKTK